MVAAALLASAAALSAADAGTGCPSAAAGPGPLQPFAPANGTDAVVPNGNRMIWASPHPVALRSLTVQPNAILVFNESASAAAWIAADYISIRGSLLAGTPDCPLRGALRLVLSTGGAQIAVPTMIPEVTSKVIVAWPGAAVSIHGEPDRAPWLRLSRSAAANTTRLCVSGKHGWRAGDELVIASSGFSADHTERATVSAVSGGCLTLAAPLQRAKYGAAPAGREALRTEVGLLSRNVVIEGDEGSATDCPELATGSAVPSPEVWAQRCFGGHSIFLHNTTVRLSGLELRRVGQANQLGRYPVHWHMAGPAGGSYIRSAAVHDSFQRCVTLHGTFDVEVSGVVCAFARGHGFFLEDAIEHGNILRGNLAVRITAGPLLCSDNAHGLESGRRVPPVAPPDAGPAGFWLSNPNNSVEGNVAAAVGGALHGFGFWLAFPKQPLNPSATYLRSLGTVADWVFAQQPLQTPLTAFRDNVAHSCYQGFQLDGLPQGSNPTGGQTCAAQGTGLYQGPANMDGLVAWKNFRGVWAHAGAVRLTSALAADNGAGVTLENTNDGPASDRRSRRVANCTFIGETDNQYPGAARESPMCVHQNPQPVGSSCKAYRPRGFEVLNGGLCLESPTFVNFSAPASVGITHWNPTTFCPDSDPYYPSPTYVGGAAELLRYDNSSVTIDGQPLDLAETSGVRNMVLYTQNDTALVAESGHLVLGHCTHRPEWGCYECPDTWYNTFQVVFDGVADPVNWTWWRAEAPEWPTRWTRHIGAVDTRFSQPGGSCTLGTADGLSGAVAKRGGAPVTLHLQAWGTQPQQRLRGGLWLGQAQIGKCTAYSSRTPPSDCRTAGDPWAAPADGPGTVALEDGWLLWSLPGDSTGADVQLTFPTADSAEFTQHPPEPTRRQCPTMAVQLPRGWAGALCAGSA
eukprot:TRINITY_DN9540_c0_g1_i1.p1 TRINITY_DN9540_c0_g1~~TRINITY_DN9540_c0_g1_i1.p1  ORF type:complete len:948 (+),score=255.67 TRINITY_DN9540_c0_g1_i1:103-2844(+)